MSDTCPVCGKGEYVDEHTWCHVSHFACVQQANKTMRVAVEAHGRLEAENERLTWDRNKYQKLYEVWASANAARADKNFQRAEQAEAHAADCKRLVTAAENDIDRLRLRCRELEAELNAQWEAGKRLAVELKQAALAALKIALRLAAGELSTYGDHTTQHPQEVYDDLVKAALAEEGGK